MKLKRFTKRFMGSFMAVLLALVFTVTLFPVKASAETTANQAVQDTTNGILQVQLLWEDSKGEEIQIKTGTCFLINTDTVLTCNHVASFTDEDVDDIVNTSDSDLTEAGKEVKDAVTEDLSKFRKKLYRKVVVSRDVTITASIYNNSEEMDFAILQLDQSLQDRNSLAIRSSATLQQTEMVYGVGFPEQSESVAVVQKFTSEDATITSGQISKVGLGGAANTFDYIQTNVKMTSGISGAPMVDSDGYVVGLCQLSTGVDNSGDYFYGIAIDQITEVLDALGIEYTKAGDTPEPVDTEEEDVVTASSETEPEEPVATVDKTALSSEIDTAKALNRDDYKSFDAVDSALNTAETLIADATATQDQVDASVTELTNAVNGLEEKPDGLSTTMIIIIAIVALIVIALIVLIVVLSGKNKNNGSDRPVETPPVSPAGSDRPTTGFEPIKPSVGSDNETTILRGAPPTTQLKKNVNGGTLINKKSREQISINAEEFIIGRERTKVNYCVTNNSSVGRVHAKVVVRDGQSYLVDLNATNGTFLNGTKCIPNQEVALKPGDKVTLADEEFTYQA